MTAHPIEKPALFKQDWFLNTVIVPIALLVILLLGHYGLFLGHTFFNDQDSAGIFIHHAGNIQSGGWRPDIAFGVSYFFHDPGAFHVWAPLRWWQELFSNPRTAYNASIIGLLWFACIAQFFLLNRTVPDLGRVNSTLLSTLIAFGSLRHELFFQRTWITLSIGTALLSLILYDFMKRPSIKSYFPYTLTLFLTLFLGSSISLLQSIIFSVFFSLIYVYYHQLHKKFQDLLLWARRIFLLNLVAGATIFLLGAWVFYSVFIELSLTSYVRDPDYSTTSFFVSSPSLIYLLQRIFAYAHAGLISPWSAALGINHSGFNPIGDWNHVSPVFPVMLALLVFYKSRNFWEFFAKTVVFGFFFWQELEFWAPGVLNIVQSTINLYPPIKFQPVIRVYQIVLMGVLIRRIQTGESIIGSLGLKVTKVVAASISLLYIGLAIVAIMSSSTPSTLNSILNSLYPWAATLVQAPENISLIMPSVISENIRLFGETMGWRSITFYTLSFSIIAIFTTSRWPQTMRMGKGQFFTSIILINSIFFAWSIFPLNKEPMIWDQQELNGVKLANTFKKTDRLMRVGIAGCKKTFNPDCIKNKYLEGEFGPRRKMTGYRLSPIFDFSAPKSFTQKDSADLITTFFDLENNNTKGLLRTLVNYPPYTPSFLYDFSATNYILSKDRLPDTNQLKVIHATKQFYLYKNLQAWDYFYLAERLKTIESYEELYNGEKGTAYIWSDDSKTRIPQKLHDPESKLKLARFEYGEMEFQYNSNENEFLVVADAWHPQWRAQIDGNETEILKTNGIFKGVLLPPGSHKVKFFFDNSVYRPGIWISIFSWVLFVCAWISLTHRESKIQRVD